MTYGQLLRKLASLSEYQLREEILLRDGADLRYTLSHVTVWDDGHEENESAEVNIFIDLKQKKLRL